MSESQIDALMLEAFGDREVIAFRPALGRALGSHSAALFLCQAMYWQKVAGAEQWFFKSRDAEREAGNMLPPSDASRQSWEWELGGMKRGDQEAARRILAGLGLLEEMKKGIPSRLHFRVNLANVAKFILKNQQLVENYQLAGRKQPACRQKTADLPVENCQLAGRKLPANTETTSETTPEIISETTTTTTASQEEVAEYLRAAEAEALRAGTSIRSRASWVRAIKQRLSAQGLTADDLELVERHRARQQQQRPSAADVRASTAEGAAAGLTQIKALKQQLGGGGKCQHQTQTR